MHELRSEKNALNDSRKIAYAVFTSTCLHNQKQSCKHSEKCGNVIPRSDVLQGAFDSTRFHARFYGADTNLQERSLFRYRLATVWIWLWLMIIKAGSSEFVKVKKKKKERKADKIRAFGVSRWKYAALHGAETKPLAKLASCAVESQQHHRHSSQ